MKTWGRMAAYALAGLVMASLMSGCGVISPWLGSPGERSAAAAAATPSPSAEPEGPSAAQADVPAESVSVVKIDIQAPEPLAALLSQHLDIVKLARQDLARQYADVEWNRLVEAAPQQARELLQTEGYFEAQIRMERQAEGQPNAVTALTVRVDPGPRVTVGSVSWNFKGGVAAAASAPADDQRHAQATQMRIRSTWALGPGEVFRNADWAQAKAQVLTQLRAAGYLEAQWQQSLAEVNPDTWRAGLSLDVDSGPLFKSGELHVTGLNLHAEPLIQNLAHLRPGSTLTEQALLDFQERLQKANLFTRAVVTPEPDPEHPETTPLKVELDEARRHQLTVGLGVSANTGPRGTLEHTDRKFMGLAASLRNKWEWGQDRQTWDGELHTHALPGLYRWVLGGAVERLLTDTDVVLSQRARLGRSQDAGRIERVNFGQFDRSARTTASDRSSAEAWSLNHKWTWRDLDHMVLPTWGQTLSLQGSAGWAQDSAGQSGGFTRLWARGNLYRTVGKQWYLHARAEAGQIFAPGGLNIPDALRFRAGGDDSVRGYAYRALGPLQADGTVGSGKLMWAGSIELARPLRVETPQFMGAVFVDAGQAADEWRQLQAAYSAGVGFRWRSPVGPLKIDLARAIEPQTWRLHFSVGLTY